MEVGRHRRAPPGSRTSVPEGPSGYLATLTEVGGTLFFTADDRTHGRELWKSDGTKGGHGPGQRTFVRVPAIVTPTGLTNVGGTLFFTAHDGHEWGGGGRRHHGRHGPNQGLPVRWTVRQRGDRRRRRVVLHFRRRCPRRGTVEVGRTEAGTVLAKDVRTGPPGAPRVLTDVGGTLFFSTMEGPGRQLWRSDGTEAGTVLIKEHRLPTTACRRLWSDRRRRHLVLQQTTTASSGASCGSRTAPRGTVLVKDISSDPLRQLLSR